MSRDKHKTTWVTDQYGYVTGWKHDTTRYKRKILRSQTMAKGIRKISDRIFRRYGPFSYGDKIKLATHVTDIFGDKERVWYPKTADTIMVILSEIVMSRHQSKYNIPFEYQTKNPIRDYYERYSKDGLTKKYRPELYQKYAIIIDNTLHVLRNNHIPEHIWEKTRKRKNIKIRTIEELNRQLI